MTLATVSNINNFLHSKMIQTSTSFKNRKKTSGSINNLTDTSTLIKSKQKKWFTSATCVQKASLANATLKNIWEKVIPRLATFAVEPSRTNLFWKRTKWKTSFAERKNFRVLGLQIVRSANGTSLELGTKMLERIPVFIVQQSWIAPTSFLSTNK